MMDQKEFVIWVEGYIHAWNSNEPGDIGALFTEDAAYLTGPFAEPWNGRAAIIEGWLGRNDEYGDFEFSYEVLAVNDDLGMVRGLTRYKQSLKEYSNIFLIRLDSEGRCSEFTEWWMERK